MLTVLGILAATAGVSHANCIGSSSLSNCYDSGSGNSYTSQRFGDTTITYGRNARTGSSWSQTDQQVGGTTFSNGRASDGNSWNTTRQTIGGGYSTYGGTNSRGRSVSGICGPFGCD